MRRLAVVLAVLAACSSAPDLAARAPTRRSSTPARLDDFDPTPARRVRPTVVLVRVGLIPPAVLERARRPAPDPPPRAPGDVWAALAACESSSRWDLDDRYDGGLQFDPDTWVAYGGLDYAPHAFEATPAQQVAVAERVLADQGWAAWPTCARKLGLR